MFKKSKHKNAPKGGLRLAFSLVELMISLIVVSVVAATFAPVVSKKLQSNTISAGGSGLNIIKSDCEKFSNNGGNCHTCFSNACIVCEYENCDGYLNVGKCQCESCTLRSANCIKCNSKECTKCKENYYLDSSKKCQVCPSGKYCSGNSSPMECTKINSNCKTCSSSSTCTKCNSGYYLNSAKTSCTKCEAGNYCNGQTKTACGDRTYAAAGASSCSAITTVTNCASYSKTSNACASCSAGYYLSNNACTKCSKGSYCNGSTKTTCPNGQYTDTEGNSSCQTCPAGYYCKNGTKTACGTKQYSSSGASSCSSSTNVNNCSKYSTSENKCDTCNSGYALSNGVCENIGYAKLLYGLYITKYNMGDNSSTQIPSAAGVTIVTAGTTCNSSKCCWKGSTSGSGCDAKNGIYSGCNRTVCNWAAANAICANYKQDNRTWKLPPQGAMRNWAGYSKGKGSEGIMLCDNTSGYSSAYCAKSTQCVGGVSSSECYPNRVWAEAYILNIAPNYVWYLELQSGSFSVSNYISTFCKFRDPVLGICFQYGMPTLAEAGQSVRCVSDTVANCSTYSEANACTKCNTSYYLKNGKCNAVTKVDNCSTYSPTEDKCTACEDGYNLSGNKCIFACTSSKYYKIGSLCVTKGGVGAIPTAASVTIANSGSTCSDQKCCWWGEGTSCNDDNSSSNSGCYRTICNWNAANAICANLGDGGKTWRLPTTAEMSNWLTYSKDKGDDGLALCDRSSGYSSAYCGTYSKCYGADSSQCNPSNVWSSTLSGSSYAFKYSLSYGSWGKTSYSKTMANAVYCVTSM